MRGGIQLAADLFPYPVLGKYSKCIRKAFPNTSVLRESEEEGQRRRRYVRPEFQSINKVSRQHSESCPEVIKNRSESIMKASTKHSRNIQNLPSDHHKSTQRVFRNHL